MLASASAARLPRASAPEIWLPALATAIAAAAASAIFLTVTILGSATGSVPSATASGATAGSAEATLTETRGRVSSPGAPAAHDASAVSAALDKTIRDTLGPDVNHYSVSVYRQADGASASINGNTVYYAASLFKLAVLYEVERQRTDGTLDISGSIALTADDAAEDLGTLSRLGLGAGDSIPIETALKAMVTASDNSTAVALLRTVGASETDTTLRNLGILRMDVNTPLLPTTADDMARLMSAVVNGTGVSKQAAAEMRTLLSEQETRAGIPAGIPTGVTVGNKTGTWDGNTHDVAFVDAPGGTYVIAVLSDRGWVWPPIARVSRAVYDVLAKQS